MARDIWADLMAGIQFYCIYKHLWEVFLAGCALFVRFAKISHAQYNTQHFNTTNGISVLGNLQVTPGQNPDSPPKAIYSLGPTGNKWQALLSYLSGSTQIVSFQPWHSRQAPVIRGHI